MLEMFNGKELTVGDLRDILRDVPDNVLVYTENVQDGSNRHNEICGYENDEGDEYFVLKIDNEAQKEKEEIIDSIETIREDLYKLTE